LSDRPQRYEYHVEPVFNPIRTGDLLDSFAEEGWRLTAVAWPEQDGQFTDEVTGNKGKGPWLFLEREYRPAGTQEES
jgi:hypothetical protein